MADMKFCQGVNVKQFDFKNGSFILKASIKVDVFVQQAKNGWINFDICKSKKGNWYAKLNEWQPKKEKPSNELPTSDNNTDEIPF